MKTYLRKKKPPASNKRTTYSTGFSSSYKPGSQYKEIGNLIRSESNPRHNNRSGYSCGNHADDTNRKQFGRYMSGLLRGKRKSDPEKDCSPTWYGETIPVMDESTGSYTGKIKVIYNDAELKGPCVKTCVKQHEGVHVRQLRPFVDRMVKCDKEAGKDWDKKGKCTAISNKWYSDNFHKNECEAYQKSYTCLTLHVINPKSPCSKPPHRKHVDKHRKYDYCELKKHCKKAGTPEKSLLTS